MWWIILLFLVFGNGYGGYGNRQGGGPSGGGDALYPWMNQAQNNWEGVSTIQNSLTNGFAGVNQALCNGFAGVQNGFAQAEIAANARQMADMQENFALQSQLAQCCCDNRAATADLKYTVATENCADRTAAAQNTRDIIDAQTRGTQAILDKLCALELDGVKNQLAQAQRDNVGLQNQLNMAALRESQTAQNAFIQQGFANEVDQLYNRLNNCPVPTTPVYGRTPIFTCNGNNGCGCGCGNGFAN